MLYRNEMHQTCHDRMKVGDYAETDGDERHQLSHILCCDFEYRLTAAGFTVAAFLFVVGVHRNLGPIRVSLGKRQAVVIAIFAFLGFWFVAVLSGFHAYLVCTNQTTYENFRDGYSWRENPHNKGIVGNCWEAFCAPSPASRFDFRRPPSRQPPDRDLAEEEAKEAAKKAKASCGCLPF